MIGHTRLVVAVALGLFAWSLSADAQQPARVAQVGILSDESPLLAAKTFEPFAQGLRDLGWVEGQNIAFERRYADDNYEILPSLAAELVRLPPDVILAIGTPAARAAKAATSDNPCRLCADFRSHRPGPHSRACAAGRESHRLKRAGARARRETAGIARHGGPGCQARGRPLGSGFPVRRPRTQRGGRRCSALEPGAHSSGGAEP